jgi:hypothetical protein
MALYRIRFIAANPERELVQQFAGCADEHDARLKLRKIFTVVLIKRVELVIDGK